MKVSGDKQCTRRTESLSKHSAVGRGWREAVRSGGKGEKVCAGILIDFMSTHIDFLLILRLGEKCAGYLKLPDTRMPDKRDFTVHLKAFSVASFTRTPVRL